MTEGLTYFDSSALVKLVLLEEVGAGLAASIFNGDANLVTSLLSYLETRSALARRFRNHQLNDSELRTSLSRFDLIWPSFGVVSVDDANVMLAAELVSQFPLSGADAVQLATALSTEAETKVTFVTWDRRQARAASDLGFTVQPPID